MTGTAPTTDSPLWAIRKSLNLTQAEFAKAFGITARAYQDLENGKTQAKAMHMLAAERLAIQIAAETKDITKISKEIRREVLAIAHEIA